MARWYSGAPARESVPTDSPPPSAGPRPPFPQFGAVGCRSARRDARCRHVDLGDGGGDRDGDHPQGNDEGQDRDHGSGHHPPDQHLNDRSVSIGRMRTHLTPSGRTHLPAPSLTCDNAGRVFRNPSPHPTRCALSGAPLTLRVTGAVAMGTIRLDRIVREAQIVGLKPRGRRTRGRTIEYGSHGLDHGVSGGDEGPSQPDPGHR